MRKINRERMIYREKAMETEIKRYREREKAIETEINRNRERVKKESENGPKETLAQWLTYAWSR